MDIDKFVEGLADTEQMFDISKDFEAESRPAKQEGEEAKADEHEEKAIPFNRDPKVQKFIERQVRKKLEELAPTAQKSESPQKEAGGEIPDEFLSMFGDNEDTRKAWKHQEKLFEKFVEKAKAEAVESIRSEQKAREQEVSSYENLIDDELSRIEEAHGIDFTDESRSEFLGLVQQLSPKDGNGKIASLADFDGVYEIYRGMEKKNPTLDRQKRLASRSGEKSGTAEVVEQSGYRKGMGFDGFRSQFRL